MSKYEQNRLLVLNEPLSPRLSPALAKEIGLNESILFLQLEFLIAVSNHEHDDKRWTYQSQRGLQEIFPFWSTATIHRAVKSLEEQELIFIGNYNKRKADRTRWFAINPAGVARLQSISLLAIQNEPTIVHNELAIVQNELTLPETTTERNTNGEKASPLPGGKTPPKTNGKKKETDPRIQPLLKEFEKLVGYSLPNYGQEAKAAKMMLKNYKPAEILACWRYMQKDNDFWKDKHCGMASVNKQIGKWREGQSGNGGRIHSV